MSRVSDSLLGPGYEARHLWARLVKAWILHEKKKKKKKKKKLKIEFPAKKRMMSFLS